MDARQNTAIVNFIWKIADDVLRDVFVRGKYRDVILPMTVIRRLDAVLEPSKDAVLERKRWAEANNISNADPLLRGAAGHPFYNLSSFTLRSLLNSPSQLRANFIEYLDSFSPNVRAILDQFEFRNQINKLDKEDRLGLLIKTFTDPDINLSPSPAGGKPGLDNHAMGTVFEELIRKFNEENNEEAGEHFTPRDVVTLMADLILKPVADSIQDGTYLIYDGACGTGGMLTVADDRLQEIAKEHGKKIGVDLYGQEVNGETWAISRADQLIKGDDADNIAHGSTLADDAFPAMTFDFMLSNPPYGKSWVADLTRLGGEGGKKGVKDPRFVTTHAGDAEYSMMTRSSDGQLMFLVNKLSKMKHDTTLGSRIAEVHNGSSLFTGDAGSGESNIRRWIIENDWLEAIIALPNNMFYNTGIATYIWVLTNRKPEHRKGKVQLIDATKRFTPRRKNLGAKNADLSESDQQAILNEFLAFEETETSRIFPNDAFGYRKVTVDRPLRLRVTIPTETSLVGEALVSSRSTGGRHTGEADSMAYLALPAPVREVLQAVATETRTGDDGHRPWTCDDYAVFGAALTRIAKQRGVRLTATLKKQIQAAIAERDETAKPIVKKRAYDTVEYEPDPELRDTEQIPLTESVEDFMAREVLPYSPDAWVADGSEKIGYEISFTRYFYKPQRLRTLAEIEADIRALEQETDGLLEEILVEVN